MCIFAETVDKHFMNKHLIPFLAFACLLVLSCTKDNPNKKYLDYVLQDYRALAAAYPEAKDRFVETRFTLDKQISEAPASEIKAESMTTYCYAWLEGKSQIFVIDRNLVTGETQMVNYSADSPWLGDSQVSESVLKSLSFSLEDAIAAAQKEASGGDGLNTVNITLRKPVYPFWDNPQYVFGGSGGRKDHVFVDAKNGKVSIEEMPVPEGSAQSFIIDDYSKIVDVYKNESKLGYSIELQGHLVEIQYTLNSPVNAAYASDIEAAQIAYVFYYPAENGNPNLLITVIRKSMKIGSELSEYKEEIISSRASEGKFINPDYIDGSIGLEDAVSAVKLGNVTDPDTDQVTFCHPIDKNTPVFLFKGKKTASVYVDALSGEIVP